jgi:hypothetical protein
MGSANVHGKLRKFRAQSMLVSETSIIPYLHVGRFLRVL